MKVFSRLENMHRLQVLQRTYLNGFDEHWTDKTSCVLLNLKKSNLKSEQFINLFWTFRHKLACFVLIIIITFVWNNTIYSSLNSIQLYSFIFL